MTATIEVREDLRTPSLLPNRLPGIQQRLDIRESYIQLGESAYRNKYFDVAELMFVEALRESNQPLPADLSLENILCQLGRSFFEQQRYRRAEVCLKRAVSLFIRSKRLHCPAACEAIGMLAQIAAVDGKFNHAEKLFKKQWLLSKRVFGGKDLRAFEAIGQLVLLYQKYGRVERAEALRRRLRPA